MVLKGTVHSKIKMLSSFTHPYVGQDLYECLSSDEHKRRYCLEMLLTNYSICIVFFLSYGCQ